MNRILKKLYLLVLFFPLLFCLPVRADTALVQATGMYKQSEARAMLDTINAFRTGSDAWYWESNNTTKHVCSGLKPLQYDVNLELTAMVRAMELAFLYDHTRPNGTLCFSAYPDVWAAGENIAAGYSSAKSVFTAWQENNEKYAGQGHRRNMLEDGFNAVGIAGVTYNGSTYWVQAFAYIPSPTGFATQAIDANIGVDVRITLSNISGFSLGSTTGTFTIGYGQTVDIPQTIGIRYGYSGRYNPVVLNESISWSSRDTSVASLSGNTLSGISCGTTKLDATILGQAASVDINVSPLDISDAKVTLTAKEFLYSGEPTKPKATVTTSSGTRLKEGSDYTLSYSNNIYEGTASIIISGRGNYTGRQTLSFKIVSKIGKGRYRLTGSSVAFIGPAKSTTTSLTIPNTVKLGGKSYKVTAVSDGACQNCSKLKSLTIGKNVKSIGKNAFYGCSKIKKVTINTKQLKAKKVGINAFTGVKKATFYCPKGKSSSYRKILTGKGASACTFK